MSALAAMQDKTMHLENNLSAETKIKMDLFSALGEVKRQLEIQRSKLLNISPFFSLRMCVFTFVVLVRLRITCCQVAMRKSQYV